ncbi:MAG: hypothetical protein ACR2J8_08150, partial [Thermomicrobiales bacterium]
APGDAGLVGGGIDGSGIVVLMGAARVEGCGDMNGGGIWIRGQTSAIVMNDSAAIDGCYADDGGGGVRLGDGATLTMNDQSAIRNCQAG